MTRASMPNALPTNSTDCGSAPRKLLGHRQPREQMPACATARDDHPHPQPVMRDSAASMPTSIIVTSIAEPP